MPRHKEMLTVPNLRRIMHNWAALKDRESGNRRGRSITPDRLGDLLMPAICESPRLQQQLKPYARKVLRLVEGTR